MRRINDICKNSEANYSNIINLFPYPITITVNGIIVLANEQALNLFGPVIIGENIKKLLDPGLKIIISKKMKQMLEKKIPKVVFDYRFINNNTVHDLEITLCNIFYNRKPAILSLACDITERKRELNSAANFQKQVIQKTFPLLDKVDLGVLYVPAKTVSGDFYFFHKVNNNLLVGILGDVSGKGITAALSISAFNVLFHEAVLLSHTPSEIVDILNTKVAIYLGEKYVAACCFSIDFINNEVKVVGAGINHFFFQHSTSKFVKNVVKGPFLGMFESSIFDQQRIQFRPGDKFYFFTDGLDSILLDHEIEEKFIKTATPTEIVNCLSDILDNMLTNAEGIKDDCTLLALEIK